MESDQQPLLAKPSETTKECMNTRVKIMLYSLIYNCALTITTTIEPQFVYSYLKNQYKNNSNIEAKNYSKIEAKTCVQNSTSSDDRLQELSSDWSWYMQLAEAGVALPVLMIVGPIADRIGRKPVLMWNLIITLLSFVFKTVIVYRNMNLYYYTVACGIFGLAGSFYAYQITNFAILADITTGGKDRSFMMTLYDALSAIGVVAFQIGTGYLIQLIGFTDPYLISTGLFLFMCIFVQFTLLDSWKPPDKLAKLRIKEITLELFSFCLNDHSMNKSYKLVTFVLEFLSYCLFYIPHCVVISILTLYQLGMPFCWTSEHIGWYGAGASFVSFIGGVIILKIMHTMCSGLKDEMITLLGMLSYLSTYILYGVSSTDWILYAGTSCCITNSCYLFNTRYPIPPLLDNYIYIYLLHSEPIIIEGPSWL